MKTRRKKISLPPKSSDEDDMLDQPEDVQMVKQEEEDEVELENDVGGAQKCPTCGIIYEGKVRLRNHIAMAHLNVKPSSCEYCGKKFFDKANYQEHLITHQPQKVCEFCQLQFGGAEACARHVVNVHYNLKPFKCPHCEIRFSERCVVRKHVKFVHVDNVPKSKCKLCLLVMSTKTFPSHYERMHLRAKPYFCFKCDNRYLTRSDLEVHKKKIHCTQKDGGQNEEIVSKCNVCPSTFKTRAMFLKHYKFVHENAGNDDHTSGLTCNVCKKTFVTTDFCNDHVENVHDYDDDDEYDLSCEFCTKIYKSHADWRSHLIDAHPEKSVKFAESEVVM